MSHQSLPDDELTAQVERLRRVAFVMVRNRDDAEDLVQEALARAIAGARTWDSERDLGAWLIGILRNAYRDSLRRNRVRARAADTLQVWEPLAASPEALGRVEFGETMALLRTLPPEQQQVLLLVAVEGLSYQDAAVLLDVPLGTVMSRLGRGREALRRAADRGGARRLRVVD